MSYHVHPHNCPGPHPKNLIDICPVLGCPMSAEARHLELNYSLGNIGHVEGRATVADEKVVYRQRYHRRVVEWMGKHYFLWVLHDEKWVVPNPYPSPADEDTGHRFPN